MTERANVQMLEAAAARRASAAGGDRQYSRETFQRPARLGKSPMTNPDRSRKTRVLFIVSVIVFALGAIYGYWQGASGEHGSPARGLDWAWKNGLLFAVCCFVIGLFGPVFVAIKSDVGRVALYSLLFGVFMAALAAGGSIIQGAYEDLASESLRKFFTGLLVGAIAGWIMRRRLAATPVAPHPVAQP
jgi:hypothetical protein